MTATIAASSRKVPLVTVRVFAGVLGSVQLAGAVFFLLLAPEEAVWAGPWVDVPITVLLVAGVLLKIALAALPRLTATRRIAMGFLAVAIGFAVTLVKIPVYQEPEGVLFLVFDGVLLVLLLLARRAAQR